MTSKTVTKFFCVIHGLFCCFVLISLPECSGEGVRSNVDLDITPTEGLAGMHTRAHGLSYIQGTWIDKEVPRIDELRFCPGVKADHYSLSSSGRQYWVNGSENVVPAWIRAKSKEPLAPAARLSRRGLSSISLPYWPQRPIWNKEETSVAWLESNLFSVKLIQDNKALLKCSTVKEINYWFQHDEDGNEQLCCVYWGPGGLCQRIGEQTVPIHPQHRVSFLECASGKASGVYIKTEGSKQYISRHKKDVSPRYDCIRHLCSSPDNKVHYFEVKDEEGEYVYVLQETDDYGKVLFPLSKGENLIEVRCVETEYPLFIVRTGLRKEKKNKYSQIKLLIQKPSELTSQVLEFDEIYIQQTIVSPDKKRWFVSGVLCNRTPETGGTMSSFVLDSNKSTIFLINAIIPTMTYDPAGDRLSFVAQKNDSFDFMQNYVKIASVSDKGTIHGIHIAPKSDEVYFLTSNNGVLSVNSSKQGVISQERVDLLKSFDDNTGLYVTGQVVDSIASNTKLRPQTAVSGVNYVDVTDYINPPPSRIVRYSIHDIYGNKWENLLYVSAIWTSKDNQRWVAIVQTENDLKYSFLVDGVLREKFDCVLLLDWTTIPQNAPLRITTLGFKEGAWHKITVEVPTDNEKL